MTLRLNLLLAAAVAARLLAHASTALAADAVMGPDEPLRDVAPVPHVAIGAWDIARLDGDLRVSRAILVLPLRDRDGLARLLAAQQDPSSSEFRRWLSPDEFGSRFGAPEADVAALRAHLEAHGLEVEDPPGGRTALAFSGRAADVERAFDTELHEVWVNGVVGVANVRPARLPGSLARRTAGLLSLNSLEHRRSLSRRAPEFTFQGSHFLAPADVSTLYGIDALAAAGLTGSGRKIAIPAQSNIVLDDTRFFRQYFGLPVNDPQVILNGPDPGIVSSGSYDDEATLDVQWSGGVAPGAQILLVVTKFDDVTGGGVDASALYAVSNNLADILSLSYGYCEAFLTDADIEFYANMWAQAAVQGITVLVSSGDSGVAGCKGLGAGGASIASVNGLGSSPYATTVGGTQFLDSPSSAYWNSTNDAVTKKSAKEMIPEATWNESSSGASGGGVSTVFTRPPWQAVAGIPAGSMRAVPDVSLAASTKNAYAVIKGHTSTATGLAFFGGTSVASPSFAGIAALVGQRAGSRLGNLNPLLYALGAAQYGTSGAASAGAGPFRDVTTGSNTVPGVTGYAAGPGYDAATGLGSVDASALSASLPSPSVAGVDLALLASPAVVSVAPGGSVAVSFALTQSATAADAVATLALSGLPGGLTASFGPSKVDDATTGIVSRAANTFLTLTAAASAAPGTYRIDATATSGGVSRRVALFVTVGSVAAAPPSGPGVQAPVVLDVFGAGGSHYTSDLVAVNRGAADVTLLLRFAQTPAPSSPGPVIARSLGAGRQFAVTDVVAFLGANGYALPSDASSKLGTLFATFVGATDPLTIYVGSRTSTPNPNAGVGGSFGTFSAAVTVGAASSSDAWIYGLRENTGYRSNLALVHAPGAATGATSGPVEVEVQLYDGDSGGQAGAPLKHTLQPGEFFQYDRILDNTSTGVTNGYARVRLTSGIDRFIAYGIVNDGPSTGGGTSDGSFLSANATEGLVPIILDVPGPPHFTTDLTLTNATSSPVTATLTYTAATVFNSNGEGSGTKSITLGKLEQLVVPNAIDYLRSLLLPIPVGGNQGGTLLVTGAVAQARTSNPNPDASVGGTYGLSYPAVASPARARSEAWVYGLRQDANVRSNLAIADARIGGGSVDYVLDVFDADTGSPTPVQTQTISLGGGQWNQVNGILAGAGIAHGYVRVRPASGTSDFVAYGVVNDGPTAGSRTSDGSYIPMVVIN